jgi:hypothetical protein
MQMGMNRHFILGSGGPHRSIRPLAEEGKIEIAITNTPSSAANSAITGATPLPIRLQNRQTNIRESIPRPISLIHPFPLQQLIEPPPGCPGSKPRSIFLSYLPGLA